MTRSAAEIGAGLSAARDARAIRAGERIHVVGIAGAGASAAAILAQAAGAVVTGCDPGGPSPYTPAVEAAGLPIDWHHDPAHVTSEPRPTRLAVTKALTAIAPDHPELAAARTAGIPLDPWHQVVADAAVGRTLVAVAGTHGKSTTAGWLLHVLVEAGRDPSAFVGAVLPGSLTSGVPGTARVGGGTSFIVEADEYAGNFEPYRPELALVTNVEWDHPDVFADLEAALAMFERWLRTSAAAVKRPTLVINVGDEGAATLRDRLTDWPGDIVEVAVLMEIEEPVAATAPLSPSTAQAHPERLTARILATTPAGTHVAFVGGRLDEPFHAQLPTAGRHNVANALVVAGAAVALGVGSADLARGLETFPGVGRRLERLGEARHVVVYDDYGHHPTAIRETLAAIRQREPGRPIWAVYEPLTYHRTAAMLGDFATVLATADGAVIANIWAGRDQDTTVTSARRLAAAIRRKNPALVVAAPGTVEASATWLAAHVRPNDAVLVMGGGQSYRIGRLLLEALAT
jgi:UDP-N-acetylmuramate--alanine ligase